MHRLDTHRPSLLAQYAAGGLIESFGQNVCSQLGEALRAVGHRVHGAQLNRAAGALLKPNGRAALDGLACQVTSLLVEMSGHPKQNGDFVHAFLFFFLLL